MKRTILLFGCLVIILSSFRSDKFDCESYYPTIVGAKLEYAYYDDKNKPTGYSKQEVKEVKELDNGIEVTMAIESTDKKNENPYISEFVFRCEDNKFYVDMSNMMPPETMEAYKDMQVEMDADFLEFPSKPTAGQTLPDGHMTMLVKSSDITIMTMTMDITNRKVDGFETITTPAGTFDCVKFSQTVNTKSIFKMTSNSTSWYCMNVGMIRSEDYNEKGKLRSVSLLTGYTK
ncbi:MAG: hypothetical protein IPG60_00690 [Bacteroidetes bacterium]|nr:hypothetical protein [Bacteroidota bacterium]MBP8754558.1 hypothetical protein [Chitinophagales bacterium]